MSSLLYPYALHAQVIWEMITGTRPWESAPTHVAVALQVAHHGGRPPLPKSSNAWPPELIELVTRCWAQDPQQRPSAADVVWELQGMLSSYSPPIFVSLRK